MRFAHWFTLGEGQGGGETCFPNHFEYLFSLIKDLIIPKSQYAITLGSEPSITFGVPNSRLPMLPAIKLYDDPRIK